MRGGVGRGGFTVELLEDAVDGAGAAAAGHGDVELVGVRVGHCRGTIGSGLDGRVCMVSVLRLGLESKGTDGGEDQGSRLEGVIFP